MNLDDMRSKWKKHQLELAVDGAEGIAARVRSKAARFERAIDRRDLLETGAAGAVVVIFGSAFFQVPGWIARAGTLTILAGAVVIIIVLRWARRAQTIPRYDLPIAEFCAAEVRRIETQITIIRHVAWWYIAPIIIGCYLFTIGIWPSPLITAVSCTLLTLFGFFVYWLNQRAVKRELIPLRDELSGICRQCDENDPPA